MRSTDLSKVSSDVPIELLPLSQFKFHYRFRSALRQTETFIAEAHHIRTPQEVVKLKVN